MTSLPLLSLVTFTPLIGVAVLLFLVKNDDENRVQVFASRLVALGTTLVTLALAGLVCWSFEPLDTAFQLVEKANWIKSFNISYHMGVDGISVWFVALSALLMPLAILTAWSVKTRVRGFMIALLLLETMMIGAFLALDLVLFYLFFEGVLIPMFLIIGVWGGEGRVHAAFKFFLYTFLGSVLMLVAIFYMAQAVGTTDMTAMTGNKFSKDVALWLWLAFFASFAVKTPMWPFHTWLPYAHVEAPTAGSVILAGVLLKMGGYGLIRISLQMFPEASACFAPMVWGLSVVAIIYGSLVALAQTDMKKLVAYSSVAHMGFATLGLFSLNQQGLDGAMFVMLSHGFVSAALFMGVGVVYDRMHTREIKSFGGLADTMPRYATYFMIFTLASIGLPGTSGFVGEFLSMQGAFEASSLAAFGAGFGLILGAAYMLWLYRRVFYGTAASEQTRAMPDIGLREQVMFLPLAALVLFIGVQPIYLSRFFAPATQHMAVELKNYVGGHL